MLTVINFQQNSTNLGRHSDIRTNPHKLNKLFQKGVCMSPPLPRSEPVCQNQSLQVFGYNFDMYHFEYIDHTLYYSHESLVEEYKKRQSRIASCSHSFDQKELDIIMSQIEY